MKVLDHLRAAAEAQETATPGPWYQVFDSYDEDGPLAEPWPTGEIEAEDGHDVAHCGRMENVGFLVAASSIPFAKVLAVVEAAAWRQELLEAIEAGQSSAKEAKDRKEWARRMRAIGGLRLSMIQAETDLTAALAELEVE